VVLVIGGISSGKRSYVKKHFGYSDSDLADAVLDGRPVVYNVQDLVFAGRATYEQLLESLQSKEVVICNEVGSGVVPIDRDERAARDTAGRLCMALAERATMVVRLTCGIPAVIKGDRL
jgi:adenosyl cobinamide kinase/adenosyl cobinamide phosphate guanylyltransferase